MPELLKWIICAFNTNSMKHNFLDPQKKSNPCCYAKVKFRNWRRTDHSHKLSAADSNTTRLLLQ